MSFQKVTSIPDLNPTQLAAYISGDAEYEDYQEYCAQKSIKDKDDEHDQDIQNIRSVRR